MHGSLVVFCLKINGAVSESIVRAFLLHIRIIGAILDDSTSGVRIENHVSKITSFALKFKI